MTSEVEFENVSTASTARRGESSMSLPTGELKRLLKANISTLLREISEDDSVQSESGLEVCHEDNRWEPCSITAVHPNGLLTLNLLGTNKTVCDVEPTTVRKRERQRRVGSPKPCNVSSPHTETEDMHGVDEMSSLLRAKEAAHRRKKTEDRKALLARWGMNISDYPGEGGVSDLSTTKTFEGNQFGTTTTNERWVCQKEGLPYGGNRTLFNEVMEVSRLYNMFESNDKKAVTQWIKENIPDMSVSSLEKTMPTSEDMPIDESMALMPRNESRLILHQRKNRRLRRKRKGNFEGFIAGADDVSTEEMEIRNRKIFRYQAAYDSGQGYD
ncbi:hypothetical protein AAMO2058_000982300 [Amorphochlora amoebiformis]|mmetsp:Transcript_33410/g.53716  ORF Transcript_33410/g.53716 Transcript_33410/m.53716 type:complete len:328 (-) Transcript_33410:47-1030(-)